MINIYFFFIEYMPEINNKNKIKLSRKNKKYKFKMCKKSKKIGRCMCENKQCEKNDSPNTEK